jgi:hypothetical protein
MRQRLEPSLTEGVSAQRGAGKMPTLPLGSVRGRWNQASRLFFCRVTAGREHISANFNEAVILSPERFGATGLEPGVERSGTPGMGIVCEQALKARLEIRFGIEVALCRAYILAPWALRSAAV